MAVEIADVIPMLRKSIFRGGFPRTDAQRKTRHKGLFGTTQLPPRGTGRGLNVYQEAVNRER